MHTVLSTQLKNIKALTMYQLDLLSLLVPRYSNTSKTWPRGRSLTSTLIQLSQVRMCNYQLIASYLNEFIKISLQRTVLRPSSILIFKLDTCLASLLHKYCILYIQTGHMSCQAITRSMVGRHLSFITPCMKPRKRYQTQIPPRQDAVFTTTGR